MAKGNKVTFPEFRAKTKEEQREIILDIASWCIDGASLTLARYIEIYFDVTAEEQKYRALFLYERSNDD